MAAQPLRRDEVVERPLAAGGAESGEVPAAVTQRIERIPVAIEPDRRPVEALAEAEEILVDVIGGRATLGHPTAGEIHHRLRDLGLAAAPGHGKSAAARMAADGDARAIDEGLRQQHRRQRVEIAQRALRTGQRQRGLAAIALRAIGREALVVSAFRTAPPAARRQDDGPAARREPVGQRPGIVAAGKEGGIAAAAGRPVMEDQCREWPVAGRLVGDGGDLHRFAVDHERRHRAFLRGHGARQGKAERQKKKLRFSAGVEHWCDLRAGQGNNA